MIARFWRKRLYRPEAVGLVLKDVCRARGPVLDTGRHLEEAAAWLLRAQAATPDDGISGGYAFEDGWIASYPETTGYTIPTLLTYAASANRPDCRDRALAMARWETRVQLPSGGFPGYFVDRDNPPCVFNTGQIIFGLLAAYEASHDERFLDSANRAAAWLVDVMDPDGVWRRFDYLNQVHSYNTRTAWALVELANVTRNDEMLAAARRHLDWACAQQRENGWYEYSSFSADTPPFLHTIAYTSQGLLESGLRLKEPRYVEAAERTCRALLRHVDAQGWIPGAFDRNWNPAASYSCLTGNAQTSVQWLRLYTRSGDEVFLEAALRTNRLLKALQDCATSNDHVRGATKGSDPIWGGYLFGTYPNWATKFFMDTLLLEQAVAAGTSECIRSW